MLQDKIKITMYGRGGSTSSGDWHVFYKEVRTDFSGHNYTAELSKSFFRKADMLAFVQAHS